jgi:predicted DNA-binding transcriptional regulator YafY
MTFRIAGLDEIERWVLSFGPEAFVEPEQLKQMVRKDLSKNLAQYSKPLVSGSLAKEMRSS